MKGKLKGKESAVCEMYKSGISARQIASMFDCAKTSVFSCLKQNGIPMQYPVKSEIAKKAREKKRDEQAQTVDVSQEVLQALKRNNELLERIIAILE